MEKKYEDRYLFPAVCRKYGNSYSVFFPDLPGCVATGETANEALQNAREGAALHILGMEEDGDTVPTASAADSIQLKEGQIVCYLDIDMLPVHAKVANQMVKKTLSLPRWLNEQGERHHLNFSRILRDGVEAKLRAMDV